MTEKKYQKRIYSKKKCPEKNSLMLKDHEEHRKKIENNLSIER